MAMPSDHQSYMKTPGDAGSNCEHYIPLDMQAGDEEWT